MSKKSIEIRKKPYSLLAISYSPFASGTARGFTLIELLLAISLLSFLIGLLWVIGQDASEAAMVENQRQIILDETGRTEGDITRYIQEAARVATSYTDPTTGEVSLTSPNSLVLELVSYDQSGIRLSGVMDRVVIKPDPEIPSTLIIQTIPGMGSRRANQTRRPLTTLANLDFHYFLPGDTETTDPGAFSSVTRIQVNLDAQVTVKNRTVSANFVGGGKLRNHQVEN
ncbi:MAG: prepilin-type N-terminal cleavage/methylation domain-containing protein [Patescibacteria group bacterium]